MTEEHRDVLVVPVASVVRDGDGDAVIAVVQDGVATLMKIAEGLRDQNQVEVSGTGLQSGMSVVTRGAYALPDQTRVRILEN